MDKNSRERGFRTYRRWASIALIALGAIVLLGWAIDHDTLKKIQPSLASMKINTALLFILLGSALLFRGNERRSKIIRRSLGAAIAIFAGCILLQYPLDINLGIDELFGRDSQTPPWAYPGRPAPATAFNFLIFGCALLIDPAKRQFIFHVLIALASLVSATAFCGYLYGVSSFYKISIYVSVAFHTVIGFLLACSAFLVTDSRDGVYRLLVTEEISGAMIRRLLPMVIFIPMLLGWLRLFGQRLGWYDTNFGVALLVLSLITSLTVMVFYNALALERVEAERIRGLQRQEMLLREVHHRVKNNLQVMSSLFNLQIQISEDPVLGMLLEKSRLRIQSIALVHEKLYQNKFISSLDFGEFLIDLFHELTSVLQVLAPHATLVSRVKRIHLNSSQAIPCALIINELVFNAMKYGFPDGRSGEISIAMEAIAASEPAAMLLTVSDNGIGFSEPVNPEKTSTLGMRLVTSLTNQLGGILQVSHTGGTRVEIQFPLEV